MKPQACPGCIDRMVWHLWPGRLTGFRTHVCKGSAMPMASDWAPDDLPGYWLAAYALRPDGLALRRRERELASWHTAGESALQDQ